MEKDVAVILIYNALIYSAFYTVIVTIPQLFQADYKLNDIEIGLCYLQICFGSAVACWLNGKLLDGNYRRVARSIGFPVDRKKGDDLRYYEGPSLQILSKIFSPRHAVL